MEIKKKVFRHPSFNGRVFAPIGSQKVLIGNKEYISLSPIDYVDINISTGYLCIRNMFTGGIMKLTDKGEHLSITGKYLGLFVSSINEKFYEAEIICS